jgi:fatty-acyl-CoA synthase
VPRASPATRSPASAARCWPTGFPTSSLRSLTYGGWSSSPHRIAQALDRFGPILAQGYGTLEATQISWLSTEDHLHPELHTTVGRPVPGVEVSIRDTAGKALGIGEAGEIWVRGRGVMSGYHHDPERTARVLTDGWFHTGDLGFLRPDGYLSLTGRAGDVIITATGHVHPPAIEDLLLRHPDIQSAAVFGLTNTDHDEQVCAAVVPKPARRIAPGDVTAWVREHRGAAYAPTTVLVLDELPTTGSAKPDRTALRRMGSSGP